MAWALGEALINIDKVYTSKECSKNVLFHLNRFHLSNTVIHSYALFSVLFSTSEKYAPLLYKLKIRDGRQEQWKHTSKPWNYFFLLLYFPYEHTERFATIFYYAPVTISR